METNLNKDGTNELLLPLTEKDLVALKYWVSAFVAVCILFSLGSFMRNDIIYTFAFLVLGGMIGIIYYAILPGPFGIKSAITVLLILLFALMAVVAPEALMTLLSKLPFVRFGS